MAKEIMMMMMMLMEKNANCRPVASPPVKIGGCSVFPVANTIATSFRKPKLSRPCTQFWRSTSLPAFL